MSFRFEFVGMRNDPSVGLLLFGRLLEGSVSVGDPIVIATGDGTATAVVTTFWDSLHDWLAMPFHHTVAADTMRSPFCLVVALSPATPLPGCPGVASSTARLLPDQAPP